MLAIKEIHSLTDFLRNHRTHVDRIKESHNPELLTVKGKAEIVVLDFESFQEIVTKLNQIETIEAIKEGIAAAERGEMKPAEQIFEEMKARLRGDLQAGIESGFEPLDMAEIKAEARRRLKQEQK
jgi:PHD/YefM family antitoxin component YafN of YafNO toxin-antitoxin module